MTTVRAAAPRIREIVVTALGTALGAEVSGVDFSVALDQGAVTKIGDALFEHKLIFFRDVDITPEQQLAFGRRLGEPTVHPFATQQVDGLPEVLLVENHKEKRVTSTDIWHSDETFRSVPPMATILRCEIVPTVGGDTLWADMTAAYDGLSSKMQHFLSGLEAVHDFKNHRKKFDRLSPRERHKKLAEAEEAFPNPTHPVVLTHPVSRRKVLFVNEQFTVRIAGMRENESHALLMFLFEQPRIPEYQFRFRWQPKAMAIWDNRSTQHYAANDYYPQHRKMIRVTIDEPTTEGRIE